MSYFFRYKTAVISLLAILFPLLGAAVLLTPLREDIGFFLPDEPHLAEQFSAFPLTPPARLIFLELSVSNAEAVPLLEDAVRIVRQKLVPPLFTAVHPAASLPHATTLMDFVPSLLSAAESDRYQKAATPQTLAAALPVMKDKLTGLQGLVLKEFIPADPLGMLAVLFDRLGHTGLLPANSDGRMSAPGLGGLALENGLVSADGNARLLFAETPLHAMDANGAVLVTEALDSLAPFMPAGVTVRTLSAHQQTAANVRTIRADMTRVLAASGLALSLIFLIWLRRLSALPALALPAFALLGAWGLLTAFQVQISGITLGFGAVLLGVVVDYALHIHCAMRAGVAPQNVAATLIRPLGFSFLTTTGTVSVLFLSALPGMRQVGLFSILGCSVGLVLALFALPLLYKQKPVPAAADTALSLSTLWSETLSGVDKNAAPQLSQPITPCPPHIRVMPFCLFLLCVAGAVWVGSGVSMQGNLRSLGVQDPNLVRMETEFSKRWGQGFRQSAMLVSKGPTTEDALAIADTTLGTLQALLPSHDEANGVISPLPLIPPPAQQLASRERWQNFVFSSGAGLRKDLGPNGEAERMGFSGTAFAPFLHQLSAPPLPITPSTLDHAGFGLIRALFLPQVDFDGKPGRAVLALVPDNPELLDLAREHLPAGSVIFSPVGIAQRISNAVRDDFAHMGLFALIAVTVCLAAALRSLNGFLLASVPSLAGCASLLLVFGLGGQPMNMFTVAAVPLVIGLCAEYGIFMTRHMAAPDAKSTPKAILLSGLTTLTGFGSLMLANHPALYTLGLTVGVGVGTAIPAALWLVPFLAGKRDPSRAGGRS